MSDPAAGAQARLLGGAIELTLVSAIVQLVGAIVQLVGAIVILVSATVKLVGARCPQPSARVSPNRAADWRFVGDCLESTI